MKSENASKIGLILEYSAFWNVIGYPAGIMPVTNVLPNEQSFQDKYNDEWSKLINEDAKDSKGMPVSIQVIGYAFEDEKVLGLM